MTAPVPLFELAVELVKIHERSAPGAVTVVPVIVDDLSTALPVLQAVSLTTEGVFLDTGDQALQLPVTGTGDPVRKSAVTTALTAAPASERHVTLVDQASGVLDAQFEDPPTGGAPSPGERTVLAVARAAAHGDLDEHELAVLVYQDSLIDLQFRRAVWDLAVKQLAGLPHATLRTLVFVAESPIEIGLHCQTGFGFRFAVDSGRLLRRHPAEDLTLWAARLATGDEPFVLFLGAGFSASSRLPMGNALRDSAIRRLLNITTTDPATSEHLATLFHNWIAAKSGWLTETEERMREDEYVRQLTLEQVIRAEERIYPDLPTLAEFRSHHDAVVDAPGPAVLDLTEILAHATGRLILVSVNFDQLVERHSSSELAIFASETDFAHADDYVRSYLAGSEQRIPLLKLHGTIEDPETCVVSAEQTERGISDSKLAALRALLKTNPQRRWIHVGASMRDRDLLRAFNDSDFANGTDEVWVTPYLPDTVEDYARDRLPFWSDRDLRSIDDRLISETADAFFHALRTVWPGCV